MIQSHRGTARELAITNCTIALPFPGNARPHFHVLWYAPQM